MSQENDLNAQLQALINASPSAQPQPAAAGLDLPKEQAVIPDKDYSGPAGKDGGTVMAQDPLFYSPAPKPVDKGISLPAPSTLGQFPGVATAAPVPLQPTPAPLPGASVLPVNSKMLFFTGRTGVGKDWLAKQIGARVLSADSLVYDALKEVFPSAKPQEISALVPQLRAWGDGIITPQIPITPTRFLFVKHMLGNYPSFGTPGFWIKQLVAAAQGIDAAVAITNVITADEFRALKEAGFAHWHVMVSPGTYMTRQRRQNADDRLAAALDADAIKKVSAQRAGEMLPVVWNDPVNPPSPRLNTLAQFLQAVAVANTDVSAFLE